MIRSTARSVVLIPAVLVLVALILLADVILPRGVSAATLYVVPVMLACQWLARRWAITCAAGVSVLAVIGEVFSVPGLALGAATVDQGFTLVAIWVVALVGLERAELMRQVGLSDTRHRLLLGELDHRVRNNLSSLLAFVDQLWREERLSSQTREDISGRVRSMLKVYTILAQNRWTPTTLRTLIGELLPESFREAVSCEGPLMPIAPRQLQALGLVFSELIVNSTKYGALSVGAGRISVTWSQESGQTADACLLRLRWVESDGPAPAQSTIVPGMGTRLIEGFVTHDLGGTCTLTYPSTGCDHTFVFVLDRASQSELPSPPRPGDRPERTRRRDAA